MQDEHILARKYADKWMGKALGVGLYKRRLNRKEVEDSRQVLYNCINPLARVRASSLYNNATCFPPSGNDPLFCTAAPCFLVDNARYIAQWLYV